MDVLTIIGVISFALTCMRIGYDLRKDTENMIRDTKNTDRHDSAKADDQ